MRLTPRFVPATVTVALALAVATFAGLAPPSPAH
jgi:hypothetical protein